MEIQKDENRSREERFILFFDEINKEDIPLVGGKNANLGEMITKAGVPVPGGFAVTSAAYRYFMKENKLTDKIGSIMAELTDPEDTAKLKDVGKKLRNLSSKQKYFVYHTGWNLGKIRDEMKYVMSLLDEIEHYFLTNVMK